MMLIILTLIMVIFHFPFICSFQYNHHHHHHHHHPDHWGFLYQMKAQYKLPCLATNHSSPYKIDRHIWRIKGQLAKWQKYVWGFLKHFCLTQRLYPNIDFKYSYYLRAVLRLYTCNWRCVCLHLASCRLHNVHLPCHGECLKLQNVLSTKSNLNILNYWNPTLADILQGVVDFQKSPLS